NTNPFVEPDTQFSAETAVKIAQKKTAADLNERDVILTFEANTTLVGGPSAGAAMAIATIAAIERKQLAGNAVAITGTIEADGSIGQVGGVLEKAQAAGESGTKLFLVPEGSITLVYYEKQIKQRNVGPFVIQEVSYLPRKLDLAEYAKDKWKMDVKEVADIDEAMNYYGL
ncbi:MAG: S16 family serine protease, partial [Candidatus Micrarchaeota archaeon]